MEKRPTTRALLPNRRACPCRITSSQNAALYTRPICHNQKDPLPFPLRLLRFMEPPKKVCQLYAFSLLRAHRDNLHILTAATTFTSTRRHCYTIRADAIKGMALNLRHIRWAEELKVVTLFTMWPWVAQIHNLW